MQPIPPPSPTVIPFPIAPGRPDALANRGVTILSAVPGVVPRSIVALYEHGTASSALDDGDIAEFAELFRDPRTVRFVAMNTTGRPLGMAIAAPVASVKDLARVLRVDKFRDHMAGAIARYRSWAVVVSADPSAPRNGIGKGLADQAFAAIGALNAERAYVAIRSGDRWLDRRLREHGYDCDASSNDGRRLLFSGDADLTF